MEVGEEVGVIEEGPQAGTLGGLVPVKNTPTTGTRHFTHHQRVDIKLTSSR